MEILIQEISIKENQKSDGSKPSDSLSFQRKPEWLKARVPGGENYSRLRNLIDERKLHTVCEEARCPNMGECWNSGTATFMILGDTCTRSCGFCNVKTGKMHIVDEDEPRRVGEAVAMMKLRHAVITSVNRDELFDGGAHIFANTIHEIRSRVPFCKVEVLIPDFMGSEEALNIVLNAQPDVLNHNIETVPRLYRTVRPQAHYHRSLEVLERAKARGFNTKTGIMLGLGETNDEVIEVMGDLRAVDVDIFTIGQYLQPTKNHLPVERYVHPDEFKMLKQRGMEMGFRHVESGPLVRSSYHAADQI
ncbi:MAG: lipoyl synthase [Ignavibacteriales bacterium]|nr:lipoyl synthase [Ignavibacteriales bacterium]